MRHVLVMGLVAALSALAVGCGTGVPSDDGGPVAVEATTAPTGGDARWRTTVVRRAEGGRCAERACHSAVVVAGDGSWTRTGTSGRESGAADPRAVRALTNLLRERWDRLTAEPDTDLCPTAYDGQEHIWELRRIPVGDDAHLRDADIRITRSCQHDWPTDLASELDRLWDAAGLPEI